MPIVRVEMLAGRPVEVKRELAKKLTEETARILGQKPENIFVILEDVSKENWGVGGELLSDKYPD